MSMLPHCDLVVESWRKGKSGVIGHQCQPGPHESFSHTHTKKKKNRESLPKIIETYLSVRAGFRQGREGDCMHESRLAWVGRWEMKVKATWAREDATQEWEQLTTLQREAPPLETRSTLVCPPVGTQSLH